MMGKIYTKSGDQGETGVIGGRRLGKDDPLIGVIGDLDELNSHLGLARSLISGLPKADLNPVFQDLRSVQNDLFAVAARLAGGREKLALPARTAWLEDRIDRIEEELGTLKGFIYPTGHPVAAQLFVARAVCRRAERNLVRYLNSSGAKEDEETPKINPYLNRLADYLFVSGRWVNFKMGVAEEEWKQSTSSEPE
jgi:cob(I)alamin adenosyltransferase